MKKFILGSAFLFTTSISYALPSFLEKANVKGELKEQIAKSKVSQNIKIADLNLIDGIGQSLKYKYTFEPSYVDQYYTRLDQYEVTTDVNIGTLLSVKTSPFGFSMQHGTEITFARQFQSQLDSATALPYTPLDIPMRADGFKKLKVGDFVSFRTHMNMVTTIGMVAPLTSVLNANASGFAMIQGEFMVHLFKISDTKFRMKLIALRGESKGLNAGVSSVSAPKIKILGIRPIEKKINKIFDIVPLSVGVSSGENQVVMFDYVFDSTKEKSINAYNNFTLRKVTFNDLVLSNPMRNTESVNGHLMSDLTEINDIAVSDASLSAENRSIDRIFMGKNESFSTSNGFNIKFNTFGFQQGFNYSHSHIESTERDNSISHFLFDTFSGYSKTSFIFGLYGTENTLYTNLLFKSNDKEEPVQFSDLIFSRDIKMKELSKSEFEFIKEHVSRVLPESVFNKIQWPNIDFSKGKITNGFFRNQIVFGLEALEKAPQLSFDQTLKIVLKLAEDMERPTLPPQSLNPLESTPHTANWLNDYEIDLQMVALQAYKILNPTYPIKERYNAFIELRKSEIWRGMAPRFFMEILDKETLEKSVRYDLILEGKGMSSPLRFSNGHGMEGQLYKNLSYIQSVMNNRSFDLRLFTNEKGEFTSK